ncbi:flagellar biosynthetic protein FliR [Kordiimonas pumila]|uniref:Flagellar biosynthetic protein FliR n=1 Tax=Kordiimonas pumila TaxID=2161677 RepID=A0ABV7D170_9PROT|nr:flagellar biosynthetic protein FliR [Kordiimonas pumila]
MLGDVLPAEAFAFLLITVRMAALVMVVPVFSESSIPQRMRVAFAMALSLVIYPVVSKVLPPMPANVLVLAGLFIKELTIGLILGLTIRLLMSAIHVAGTIIAFQTGLAAAQTFDPSQGSQSVLVASFFNLLAIVLILVTNLHHMMLTGMVFSYQKFPVGEAIPVADFATITTQYVSSSFALGFQMAAPFIVYGMIYNLGLGLVARMVPGFQVFFIGMPINLFMGFALIMVLMGSIMKYFLQNFQSLLEAMIG